MIRGILIWTGIVLGTSAGIVVLLWSVGGRALYAPLDWPPAMRQAALALGVFFLATAAMALVFGAIARRTWEDFYFYGRNVWDNTLRDIKSALKDEEVVRKLNEQQNVDLTADKERLEQDVKALRTERNTAQKALAEAREQLLKERRDCQEKITTLTGRLNDKDTMLKQQSQTIQDLRDGTLGKDHHHAS